MEEREEINSGEITVGTIRSGCLMRGSAPGSVKAGNMEVSGKGAVEGRAAGR